MSGFLNGVHLQLRKTENVVDNIREVPRFLRPMLNH
jgi:hypothetical protein